MSHKKKVGTSLIICNHKGNINVKTPRGKWETLDTSAWEEKELDRVALIGWKGYYQTYVVGGRCYMDFRIGPHEDIPCIRGHYLIVMHDEMEGKIQYFDIAHGREELDSRAYQLALTESRRFGLCPEF